MSTRGFSGSRRWTPSRQWHSGSRRLRAPDTDQVRTIPYSRGPSVFGKTWRAGSLALALTALSLSGATCNKRPQGAPTAAASLSPDPIVPVLRQNRIDSMCAEGTYERSCFDVDEHKCRVLVGESYDGCARQHASEVSVAANSSPGRIGILLGGCTSQRYIAEMQNLGKVNRQGRCADPASFFR